MEKKGKTMDYLSKNEESYKGYIVGAERIGIHGAWIGYASNENRELSFHIKRQRGKGAKNRCVDIVKSIIDTREENAKEGDSIPAEWLIESLKKPLSYGVEGRKKE